MTETKGWALPCQQVHPPQPHHSQSKISVLQNTTQHHLRGGAIRFCLVGFFFRPQCFSFGPTLQNPQSEVPQPENAPFVFTPKSVSVMESRRHPQTINFPAEGSFSLRLAYSRCDFTYCAGMRNWSLSPETGTGGSFTQLPCVPVTELQQPRHRKYQASWESTPELLQLTAPSTPQPSQQSLASDRAGDTTHTLGCSCSPGVKQASHTAIPLLHLNQEWVNPCAFHSWCGKTKLQKLPQRISPCLLKWRGGCVGGAEEKGDEQDLDLSS